jgi:putative spermidine/putrescine transport system permease protein
MTTDMDAATRRVYHVLLFAPLALLAVFYLYPLSRILWLSVSIPSLGFSNFEQLFTSSAIQHVLWTTVRICALTTVISLPIGYVVAYAALHLPGWRGELLLFFVLLSFWLSVLIRAFAWLTLLQSHGLINTFLMKWGAIQGPLPLVRNEFGVVVGMVHYMIPYATLPLYANMKGIDPRLVAAARGLGASPLQAFLNVYLPMSIPGLVSAGLLTFIFSLGFYVTPALLGGGKTVMIAEYISVQINETLNWGVASMLATTLLLSIFAILTTFSVFVDLHKVFGVK